MQALPSELRDLLKMDPPAALGPDRRAGTLSPTEIDQRLEPVALRENLPPAAHELLRALFYLWHDHLDASHRIAQNMETPDGSLVHAIMHRREPDYSNAKYWFRRVGSHPSFLLLALRTRELLEKRGEGDLLSLLLPNSTWDPFAFVDAVEDAQTGKFPSRIPLLQELQRIECECLIENLWRRAAEEN